jgi:hypothetical protein
LPAVLRSCLTEPEWWADEMQGLHVMNALNDLVLPADYPGYRKIMSAPSYVGHSVIGRDVCLGAFFCAAVRNLRRGTVHVIRDGALIDTAERTLGCVIADGTETGVHTTVMPGRRVVRTPVLLAHSIVMKNC